MREPRETQPGPFEERSWARRGAVGAFQVFSGPPLEPAITEFTLYLSKDASVPTATARVGYQVAETP
jgi:hypothetical protein